MDEVLRTSKDHTISQAPSHASPPSSQRSTSRISHFLILTFRLLSFLPLSLVLLLKIIVLLPTPLLLRVMTHILLLRTRRRIQSRNWIHICPKQHPHNMVFEIQASSNCFSDHQLVWSHDMYTSLAPAFEMADSHFERWDAPDSVMPRLQVRLIVIPDDQLHNINQLEEVSTL
jgi:hypothetical protein